MTSFYGVAELFHHVDLLVIKRNYHHKIRLIHHTVDTAVAIFPSDTVFAYRHPAILIHHFGVECEDFVLLLFVHALFPAV